MATPTASVRSLTRLGIPTADAEAALRRLDAFDGGPDARVLEALVATAHPPSALRALDRLASGNPEMWARVRVDDELLHRLTIVAGVSDALGDLVIADPELVDGLIDRLGPAGSDVVRRAALAAMEGAEDDQAAADALVRTQRRGLLRVAARDLFGLCDTPTTSGELANLAAGIVAAALDRVIALAPEPPEPTAVAIIGMGKLGGCELNYVSDIDVIFVHRGDLQHATRLCTKVLALLGRMTPLGAAYDVDTNLRPEGRDGPLVRTLGGYRAYYDRWARTWEQQALLKARPIAGDAELGDGFMELVEPYVWPDKRAGGTVTDIQQMKVVVEKSGAVRKVGPREVKLAPGGLRDIEFAVQLLQLVHGRHDRRLRSGNTLEALAALADGGYVDPGDANLFSDAYQFLRTVEHRLQLRALRRTHVVPSDTDDRYRLARALGFRDLRAADAREQFDRELGRVRSSVRRLHEKLFYRPLLDRFAEVSAEDVQAVGGGGGGFDDTAAAERLRALGFMAPKRSMDHLKALATGTNRADVLLRNALPTMLPTLAAGADPDGGLLALRTMAERLEHAPSFLTALRDSPPVGQILATVLSRSRLVGEWLERQPEVFKTLADARILDERLDEEAYRRVALGLARRGGDERSFADALRRFKRREIARIGVRDLTGRADAIDVAAELTGLAEACVQAALTAITGEDLRVAVIGLGKLGGGELGYRSDLDAIVVFEPGDRRIEALEVVERLLRMLSSITPEGRAFAVDLKLRPEGKDGPMARSLESTISYYERWGQPWELFALTQARPVGGDPDLGRAFVEQVAPSVWPSVVDERYAREIRTMKARIERERGSGSRARNVIDVKLGQGGLSDIEWTVQLLAVLHGGESADLRRPGVLNRLDAAVEVGALSGEEAVWLRHAWRLLTSIRNARYLGGARRTDELPMDLESLERLAIVLGYPGDGGQQLREEVTRAVRRVRRVHERHFYEA
jgi:[glutamine synthetase] adenylyltransferase / [glutamine synthetase]-adenylyl-L-tyrosine phosphorylase